MACEDELNAWITAQAAAVAAQNAADAALTAYENCLGQVGHGPGAVIMAVNTLFSQGKINWHQWVLLTDRLKELY